MNFSIKLFEIALKIPMLSFVIGLITVAVSTTSSEAFVPSPSDSIISVPNVIQHRGFAPTHSRRLGSKRLHASTLPFNNGKGVAVIDSWKLLPDGRIKGIISETGDNVLTSPLKNRNGLKEKTTVRTISGSKYKLGVPALAVSARNNLTAERLGIPRATFRGIKGNTNNVRATQPLTSERVASRDGFLQNFRANKSRATMPLNSDYSRSENNEKSDLLTPLVGGVSAIAVGTAIGTGVISDNGININKLPNPSEVWESTKSLNLPDIKSLKAPVIPSVDISLPKIGGLPSVSIPKLPDVNIPNLRNTGLKLPKSPFEKISQLPSSVGIDPYRVPMPYLDRKIVEAEREEKAQKAAVEVLAAEQKEAMRIQKLREEAEARIRLEADSRVQNTNPETDRLRAEIERTRLDALAKEKAAAEEMTRLKQELETARLNAQAAKNEFTLKLQEAELAKMREAMDFSSKLAQAEEAFTTKRALEDDLILKQRMTEEAASRQSVAAAEVRKASIGANAARKASYRSPSMSTYEAWQERQRSEYQARVNSVAEVKGVAGGTPTLSSPSSQDNLSTYKKWQQNVAAKQLVSESTEPVKAAYITGAPAPISNQLVSGTATLSEAANALNGDLGYVIAGASALIGGFTYAYEYQKIQDELSEDTEIQPMETKITAPPPTSGGSQPLPPIVPPVATIKAKQVSDSKSASVTKEVSPPPPQVNGSPSSSSRPLVSTTPVSVTREVSKRPPVTPGIPDENKSENVSSLPSDITTSADSFSPPHGTSYLESISESEFSIDAKPKKSYSPFTSEKSTEIKTSSFYDPQIKPNDFTDASDDFSAQNTDSLTRPNSYLSALGNSSEETVKTSFSPFGKKPKVVSDNVLNSQDNDYQSKENEAVQEPSDVTMPMQQTLEPMPVSPDPVLEEETHSKYLESMDGGASSFLKDQFLPFGVFKNSQSLDGTTDSLYDAPESISPESFVKNQFSPFGLSKGKQSSDGTTGTLYDPPDSSSTEQDHSD